MNKSVGIMNPVISPHRSSNITMCAGLEGRDSTDQTMATDTPSHECTHYKFLVSILNNGNSAEECTVVSEGVGG